MRVREALSVFAGVAVVALATVISAQSGPSDNPDVNEVRNYGLTLDKAQKAATAMQSINQLIAANPSLSAAMDQSANTTGKETITQQAQSIDSKYPQISAIIHANGLETRGYVVPQASDVSVAGDARWGSRPMAEHRVMSEVHLGLTHYRSKRCYESQPICQRPNGARSRRVTPPYSVCHRKGDSCGEINPLFLARRRPTLEHSPAPGDAQRQWLQARLPDGHQPQCQFSP